MRQAFRNNFQVIETLALDYSGSLSAGDTGFNILISSFQQTALDSSVRQFTPGNGLFPVYPLLAMHEPELYAYIFAAKEGYHYAHNIVGIAVAKSCKICCLCFPAALI